MVPRGSEVTAVNAIGRRSTMAQPSAGPILRKHEGDIPDAPTFKPSEGQWKDPMTYLRDIREVGHKYGIVKIIPPVGWDPDFVLDTERFYFSTRKQKLNSLKGGIGAKLDYYSQLSTFHKQHGKNCLRFPTVGGRPLDLYELKLAVEIRGGFENVCTCKQWQEIGRALSFGGKIMSSLSTLLKSHYEKLLHPYEQWLQRGKTDLEKQLKQNDGMLLNSSLRSDRKRYKSDETEGRKGAGVDAKRQKVMNHPAPKRLGENSKTVETRSECNSSIIIPQSCSNSHASGTGELGFEEGDMYFLRNFQTKANKFKKNFFKDKGYSTSPSEDDVEKHFWHLTSNLNETVEVEYGADICSTAYGSGFPTHELDRRNRYSLDPWNLNNLPRHQDSLFRHLKSDISGITTPWLYVGMCFSTFCWHTEDHHAYSANYQHFGATKTWYGVPAEDAEKFERAMQKAFPHLFEQQPDLLSQLVTLLEPSELRKAGVRVYATDQRAGEFVITFPRAYHAGFNHGFNLNEAVNFAPPDWEPFGRAAVHKLREVRRQPCFSHDELLITAAKEDLTVETAKWLAPALHSIVGSEKSRRDAFEKEIVDSNRTSLRFRRQTDSHEFDENEYLCNYCKAHCYLSCFIHPEIKRASCLDHVKLVDWGGARSGFLFYSNAKTDRLAQIVQKTLNKANARVLSIEKSEAILAGKNPKKCLNAGERYLKTIQSGIGRSLNSIDDLFQQQPGDKDFVGLDTMKLEAFAKQARNIPILREGDSRWTGPLEGCIPVDAACGRMKVRRGQFVAVNRTSPRKIWYALVLDVYKDSNGTLSVLLLRIFNPNDDKDRLYLSQCSGTRIKPEKRELIPSNDALISNTTFIRNEIFVVPWDSWPNDDGEVYFRWRQTLDVRMDCEFQLKFHTRYQRFRKKIREESDTTLRIAKPSIFI